MRRVIPAARQPDSTQFVGSCRAVVHDGSLATASSGKGGQQGPSAVSAVAPEGEPERSGSIAAPQRITTSNKKIGNEMFNYWVDLTLVRSSCFNPRWAIILCGTLLANGASAAPSDRLNVVRDIAGRLGPIIGSALACPNVARPRVQVIIDKFQAVIRETINEPDRADVVRLLDRSVADGRSAVTTGKTDCRIADRQVSDLEQSLGISSTAPTGPSLAAAIAPSSAAIAPSAANVGTASTQPLPPSNVHGVTDHEIRFGIVIPYSGGAKENGRN